MNNKKADLSMNFIIIAALALLVLVTVSLIFMGRLNIFNIQAKSCESAGGQCFDLGRGSCDAIAKSENGPSSTGRRRNDLVCYRMNGEPNDDEQCCIIV